MKRFLHNFLLSAGMLLVAFSCDTESNVDPAYKNYFIKYYGGDGHQEAKDFVVNADGTVVMVGTWTDTQGRKRVYIVKVDTEGNVIWDKKLGNGINDEFAADVELVEHGTDAGNLVVLSNHRKNSIDSMAIRLTIFSQVGDSLRSKLFNNYENQLAKSITPLIDGGFFISAKTSDQASSGNPNDPTEENILVVRLMNDFTLDPISGNVIVPNFNIGSATKIFEISSGQYCYAGYSDMDDAQNRTSVDFFFRKFTTSPENVPTVSSGSSDNNEIMMGIVRSPSGQFLAVGTLESGSNKTFVATRISSSFQSTSPMQNIISNAEGVAVASSGASDFLLLGNIYRSGTNRDIIVKKVDFSINQTMTMQFGSINNDDTGSAIAELPNGDILILGTMELVNQRKMALIKVRPNGKF